MKAPMETAARCEHPTILEERLDRAGSPKMEQHLLVKIILLASVMSEPLHL